MNRKCLKCRRNFKSEDRYIFTCTPCKSLEEGSNETGFQQPQFMESNWR